MEIVETDRETIKDFLEREWAVEDELRFGPGASEGWRKCEGALAAYREGELVGAATFTIVGGVGRLRELIVTPPWRNRGVGSALLAHFEELCRARGCHKVSLKTYWDSPAQRFYQRRGYMVESILRRDIFGVDMCEMCKFLAGGKDG